MFAIAGLTGRIAPVSSSVSYVSNADVFAKGMPCAGGSMNGEECVVSVDASFRRSLNMLRYGLLELVDGEKL